MREYENPAEGGDPSGERPAGDGRPRDGERLHVVIAVVRTGGIANLRRRWSVEPEPERAPEWVELVDRCPWDEPSEPDPGADRFVWSIHARLADQRLEQDLPDSRLRGPWRDLVDAVREASARDDAPPASEPSPSPGTTHD